MAPDAGTVPLAEPGASDRSADGQLEAGQRPARANRQVFLQVAAIAAVSALLTMLSAGNVSMSVRFGDHATLSPPAAAAASNSGLSPAPAPSTAWSEGGTTADRKGRATRERKGMGKQRGEGGQGGGTDARGGRDQGEASKEVSASKAVQEDAPAGASADRSSGTKRVPSLVCWPLAAHSRHDHNLLLSGLSATPFQCTCFLCLSMWTCMQRECVHGIYAHSLHAYTSSACVFTSSCTHMRIERRISTCPVCTRILRVCDYAFMYANVLTAFVSASSASSVSLMSSTTSPTPTQSSICFEKCKQLMRNVVVPHQWFTSVY